MKKPYKTITGMVVDDRPVQIVTFSDGGKIVLERDGVTEIRIYRELDGTPWIAVFMGADIAARIPAGWCSVAYVKGIAS